MKRKTEKQRALIKLRLENKRAKRKIELEAKKAKQAKYAAWVKAVKERDNYTCQICKQHFDDPRALPAMHILSKENYPELMYDVNNGLTGCYYDHKNSKLSPHLDGFAFVEWLRINKSEQYNYLKNWLEKHQKRAIDIHSTT